MEDFYFKDLDLLPLVRSTAFQSVIRSKSHCTRGSGLQPASLARSFARRKIKLPSAMCLAVTADGECGQGQFSRSYQKEQLR